MKHKKLWAAGLLLSLNAVSASATLFDRGNGLIYDSAQKITWMQDANYAKTSLYDSDGLMTWNDATVWAAGLVYQGYSDWRLPTTTDTGTSGCNFAYSGTDCGYNVATSSSELAHLFFIDLNNQSYVDTSGNARSGYTFTANASFSDAAHGNATDSFTNLQSYAYWSGSEYAPFTSGAWTFNTGLGSQDAVDKDLSTYAWAVLSGDVAANNNVPEPGTLALLSLGLLGLRRTQRR